MRRLVDIAIDNSAFISNGYIIRSPFPLYEELWRDLMVYDCRKEGFGAGLLVVTGRHAGTPAVYLPEESSSGHQVVISARWLADNFSKWVYECAIDQILVLDRPLPPAQNTGLRSGLPD